MHEIAWILIAVLTASVVGGVLAVRYEQRHPSSYTQPGTEPEDNRALDTAEQEEQGWVRSRSAWQAWQPNVVADASEAAQVAVERMARVNVEFRP